MLGFIKKLLPMAGSAIGGRVGNMVTKAVSNILLPDNDNPSEEEIATAYANASPAQIAKIEQAVSLAKIEADDRKSARLMSIKKGDNTVRNVLYVFSAGFIGICFLHFYMPQINMEYYSEHIVEMTMTALGFFCGRLRK